MPKSGKTIGSGGKAVGRDAATGRFDVHGKISSATRVQSVSPKSQSVIKESSSSHRDALKRLADK